jgi:hypothetical protein
MGFKARKAVKPSRVLRERVVELQTASYKATVDKLLVAKKAGQKPVFIGERQKFKLRFLDPV